MGKFILLSGPSGIGKTPLWKTLHRTHGSLVSDLRRLVLYNDRSPRPGESDGVDYHFRSTDYIRSREEDGVFRAIDVRGDIQAVDLEETAGLLSESDAIYEGNPYVATFLMSQEALSSFERISIFLSPLSSEEIEVFSNPDSNTHPPLLCADIMRRKLLRRTYAQKGQLSLPDLQNVEKRAERAYQEMKMAWMFDWVVPNHDGEDSENWQAFYYPVGEARIATSAVASLIDGKESSHAEKWSESTLR